MNISSYAKRGSPIAYFLLRVVAGFVFMQAGSAILFGWPAVQGAAALSPALKVQMTIGGILEFFGGIAILLGLVTRPVAFILSGQMAVAYFQFHFTRATWPIQNDGMAAVLYCFIYLYMAANGAGDWSLDALIRRKRERAAGAIRGNILNTGSQ